MTKIEELRKEIAELNRQIDALNEQIAAEEQRRARDAEAGTYKGEITYCTVNAMGDCPYCDKHGICHIENPMEDCDDFACFFDGSWDEWEAL